MSSHASPRWSRPAPMAGLGALALIASVAMDACAPPEKPVAHTLPESVASRVMVLNADSLVIDGKHVHLSNASAPQSAIHARCWAEAYLADNEITYVRDLIARAHAIDFKPTGQVDSYNRALGQVTLDGIDLGEQLYQEGMAARLTEPRFDWCQPVSQAADGAPPISSVIKLGQ